MKTKVVIGIVVIGIILILSITAFFYFNSNMPEEKFNKDGSGINKSQRNFINDSLLSESDKETLESCKGDFESQICRDLRDRLKGETE